MSKKEILSSNTSSNQDNTPWSEEDLKIHVTTPIVIVPASTPTKDKVPLYTSTPTREEYLAKYGDTSKAIRALLGEGRKQGEVAKLLNIRPQHVFNVKNQIIKGK